MKVKNLFRLCMTDYVLEPPKIPLHTFNTLVSLIILAFSAVYLNVTSLAETILH
jgi:hypothetical protein